MREQWRLVAWGIGIAGVAILVLVFFWGIQQIRAASAFYAIARATRGTVQESHEVTNPCVDSVHWTFDTCPVPTSCKASVMFTPPGQHTPFTLTTTADHCETLPKGTMVEILYDPSHPKTAETPDQASGEVIGAIGETLGDLLITALVVLTLFGVAMVQSERAGRKGGQGYGHP